MRKSKKSFTLLEIMICVAILGMVATVMGWQIKNMVQAHHFHKNIDHLVTDLRKAQIIALSKRCDLELLLRKEGKEYSYSLHVDEPIKGFSKKTMKLTGVKKIQIEKKPMKNQILIHIYSSGRIAPAKEIQFFQDKEKALILDLSKPLVINLSH